MNKQTEQVTALMIVMAAWLPMALFHGWIAAYLWTWFVLPTFGIPTPAIPVLAGLMLYANFLRLRKRDEQTLTQVIAELMAVVVASFILLGFAWILRLMAG